MGAITRSYQLAALNDNHTDIPNRYKFDDTRQSVSKTFDINLSAGGDAFFLDISDSQKLIGQKGNVYAVAISGSFVLQDGTISFVSSSASLYSEDGSTPLAWNTFHVFPGEVPQSGVTLNNQSVESPEGIRAPEAEAPMEPDPSEDEVDIRTDTASDSADPVALGGLTYALAGQPANIFLINAETLSYQNNPDCPLGADVKHNLQDFRVILRPQSGLGEGRVSIRLDLLKPFNAQHIEVGQCAQNERGAQLRLVGARHTPSALGFASQLYARSVTPELTPQNKSA